MSTPIRLLLVDSATVHRRALAALLKRRPNIQVLMEAQTASEARAHAQALQPDVVVVEPELPEGGPELISALCHAAPSSAVLVLSATSDPAVARAAINAGARGYLLKACEPDELIQAIQRVQAGETVVAPAIAASVLRDPGAGVSEARAPLDLTERQVEVLRLVAQGLTNAQMARELCVTEHTVKGHLAKMLGKLGLENRVQLAAYAIQHGLAAPGSAATLDIHSRSSLSEGQPHGTRRHNAEEERSGAVQETASVRTPVTPVKS